MVLAEVTLGLETLVGGGVTGMLAIVMTAFLRRTKETDDRVDANTQLIVQIAAEREARAWAERDRAVEELARLRAQIEEVRMWKTTPQKNSPSSSRPAPQKRRPPPPAD